MLAAFEPDGVLIRTRRHQRLSVAVEGETVYLVRSGVLALHATTPANRRQILSILFPGDLFRSAFAPPLPDVALTAVAPGELIRVRWSTIEAHLAREPALCSRFISQLAIGQAREALHSAIIAGLSGEQRVASFLIELALRIGRSTGAGMTFELPLARADIADYLALNADTVSRIMSRLKVKGHITLHKRGHALTRNFEALCGESPIGKTLIEMHRQWQATVSSV